MSSAVVLAVAVFSLILAVVNWTMTIVLDRRRRAPRRGQS